MEQEQHQPGWQRWSHWPAGVIVAAVAFLGVFLFSRSLLFAVAVAVLLGFLAHGETRRYLRRHIRRAPPGRPWVARPAVRRRTIVAFGLIVIAVWYGAGTATDGLTVDTARSIVDGWGPWGPILLIVLSGLAMLVAPVPNGPFAIAAGLLWGTMLGTLYALLGQILGATLAFYAARYLGRRYLPRMVGEPAAETIDQLSLSMGPHLVFWTRMAPFVPIDFTAYAAGLTAMSYRIYIFAFMLGAVLPTWIIVWVGDSLNESWSARIISFAVVLVALVAITVLYAYVHRQSLPPRRHWHRWRAWRDALITPQLAARDADK